MELGILLPYLRHNLPAFPLKTEAGDAVSEAGVGQYSFDMILTVGIECAEI